MKRCSKCQAEKPETEFYTRKGGKLYSVCKPCHLAQTAENRRAKGGVSRQEDFARRRAAAAAPTKVCPKCGTEYPRTAEHFPRDRTLDHLDGLRSYCRPCHRELSAEYRRNHPEKRAAQGARYWASRTPEQKAAIYERRRASDTP